MDNVDLNVLKTIVAWRAEGRRVTMGTIVRTWGSAPRPVGALVAIGEDASGQTAIAGSVSGGCIEDDLVDKVRAASGHALAKPERLAYGDQRATRRTASGCRAAARSSSCSSRSATGRASRS